MVGGSNNNNSFDDNDDDYVQKEEEEVDIQKLQNDLVATVKILNMIIDLLFQV
eukprot:CAMPEP_0171018324 /NCGR_PEP_ID=MMETSP0736-20130129/28219_1 /TAXON_ID=186038 /ORGANISM="Fragilariopsis kerguelensis, Strain L26-C5" /LENGTH=52 /DNA_ID=CAMNT_0011454847 /DNA_START=6 /DNA_END=164 /DNA_ORIENTATION=+